jgi:FkbM family methyltransferase
MIHRLLAAIRRFPVRAADRAYRAVKQAWKDADGDHTLRLRYPLTPESVVLDVGGYRGQWASDLYAARPSRIHVFEPVPAFADGIAERFSGNPDITLHRVALGAVDGTLPFTEAADATGRFAPRGRALALPVRAAAPYLREQGIARIDLMKLNIEGDEYDLIDHLHGEGVLADIRFIQVQFHPFVPDADARLRHAHDLLYRTHVPQYAFRYVWESWERI